MGKSWAKLAVEASRRAPEPYLPCEVRGLMLPDAFPVMDAGDVYGELGAMLGDPVLLMMVAEVALEKYGVEMESNG